MPKERPQYSKKTLINIIKNCKTMEELSHVGKLYEELEHAGDLKITHLLRAVSNIKARELTENEKF